MTTDGKNTKMTGGTPSFAAAGPTGPGAASASPAAGAPPPARDSGPSPEKSSRQKRWQETRGLLQQALADWEKSEQRATEMLKEAESDRAHLEDLLLKLKAKLDELS